MVQPTDTPDILASLERLRRGHHTGREETRQLIDGVLAGSIDLDLFGQWLLVLADVGESADEIAGVAEALRGRMLPVRTRHAVAPETSSRQLDDVGICFCLAPVHHPAMARVGPLRRSLGRPTVFNLVGPLCNPAGATVQVIGVGRASAREPLAQAAWLLGATRALVVSGHLGDDTTDHGHEKIFDEISLFGPTDVIDVSAGTTTAVRWRPEDFGIATQSPARLADLSVAGPAESAAAIRDVLAGARGPRRDVVVLNAAAVLWAAGRGTDLPAARETAEAAIDSGAAARLLDRLATTRE
jgi:anthranilate phosphoribosyltransferase